MFAMERLLSVLEGAGQRSVVIVAEKRGKNEDRELYLAFQRIVTLGTDYVPADRFKRISFELRFLPKSLNIIGTQMADLAAYPIARHVLAPSKANPPYDVVRAKFSRQLKVFP